ncbi:MAG: hypothetical protein FJ279_13835, partial [Planctomycetes bacterium]|nr:hypothetical protein [Planctomycetota bacterium]
MWPIIHILILGGLAMSLASAVAENLLPFGGFEAGNRGDRPAEFWHRAGGDYYSAYPDWKLTSDSAAAGKSCVTTASDREFVVCGETGGGNVTGSVMLRASGPAKARLRLSWWNGLNRVDEVKELQVGTTWQRFEAQTDARRAGPVELAVASKTPNVQLWADEFQVQGAPPADQMANATYRVEPSKLPDLAAQMAKLQPYDGTGKDGAGQVTLRIDVPTDAVPLPMVSGGVPFPKGKLFRAERVRVADAAGREMPCQIEVLARWHADHSIKMLLVTVPGSSASAQMTLVFGP